MKGRLIKLKRQMIVDCVNEMSRRLIEDVQKGGFDTVEIDEDEKFIKISVTSKVMGCAFLFAADAEVFAEEKANEIQN